MIEPLHRSVISTTGTTSVGLSRTQYASLKPLTTWRCKSRSLNTEQVVHFKITATNVLTWPQALPRGDIPRLLAYRK